MSLLARVPARQLAARRFAAPSRSMHGEYKHMPFEYHNKPGFATKLALYMSVGFIIPFGAAYYQIKKAGGGA